MSDNKYNITTERIMNSFIEITPHYKIVSYDEYDSDDIVDTFNYSEDKTDREKILKAFLTFVETCDDDDIKKCELQLYDPYHDQNETIYSIELGLFQKPTKRG